MAYTIAKAIAASAALLLVWIVVAATVFGLGRLTQWLLGFSHHHRVGARLTFWLGVSLACTILLGWNFLAPINGVASSTLLLVGIGACWKGRNDLASSCRSALTALGRTGLAVCIVFGFWLANHARGALTYLDSANYHIQAVRWAENFAVVPGLANLHSRLGYQSAAFLYYAAVSIRYFSRACPERGERLPAVLARRRRSRQHFWIFSRRWTISARNCGGCRGACARCLLDCARGDRLQLCDKRPRNCRWICDGERVCGSVQR